jgi:hypothetical protein
MSAEPNGNEWRGRAGLASYDPPGPDEPARRVTEIVRLAGEPKAPGTALVSAAGWLLLILAGGVLAVSFAGQFAYLDAARHQAWAANIEAGMLDVGMIIFALLGLGLAMAGKPSRTERALVMVCSLGSAAMGYAAADVGSPRSVAAYVAPPLFLAVVVDRVIAVVRRHRLGDAEASPWAPLGRAGVGLVKAAGLVLLYTLRLVLDPKNTPGGLRRLVLAAAPIPDPPADVRDSDGPSPDNGTPGTKKAVLLELYKTHEGYRDKARVAAVAAELGPLAGLQAGTARTYLGAEIKRLEATS